MYDNITYIDGQFISNLRKDTNLTQVQFASIFGIAHSTVQGWETGRSNPNAQQLVTIMQLRKRFDFMKINKSKDETANIISNILLTGGIIALMFWIFSKD